jgi:hypothetical protein
LNIKSRENELSFDLFFFISLRIFVHSLNLHRFETFFIMNKLRVLQYVYCSDSDGLVIDGKTKRQPNHFFLFTKELREHVPKELKIPAPDLNKFAGYLWNEKMTEEEKEYWRIRSQKDKLTPEEKELTEYIQKNAAITYVDRLNECSFKEFTMTQTVLKNDCFLTNSLELNWSIHL